MPWEVATDLVAAATERGGPWTAVVTTGELSLSGKDRKAPVANGVPQAVCSSFFVLHHVGTGLFLRVSAKRGQSSAAASGIAPCCLSHSIAPHDYAWGTRYPTPRPALQLLGHRERNHTVGMTELTWDDWFLAQTLPPPLLGRGIGRKTAKVTWHQIRLQFFWPSVSHLWSILFRSQSDPPPPRGEAATAFQKKN